MDKWGDHALTCSCGGDRTVRHNAIRNICFEKATDAGLRPEREKANLLPSHPAEDSLPTRGNGRHPADVWIPRGRSNISRGEPCDCAVRSGMQSALFRPAAATPTLVFQLYEDRKRSFQNTLEACENAGFDFVPLIFEAHGGGWSSANRAIFDWMSKLQAASQHENAEAISLRIAQRISCTLHRENAQAILRRLAAPAAPSTLPSGWDANGVETKT